MTTPQHKVIILQLNLSLAFIEGVLVFWSYLSAPSEAQSVVFLQYSLLRLILLSLVLSLSLVTLFLFAASFKAGWRDQGLGKSFDKIFDRTETFWGLLAWGGLMYFLLFASDQKLESLASYRERLYQILIWFALISLQFTAGFILVRGMGSQFFQVYRESLFPAGVVLILLVLIIALISITKIGLSPDPIYWQGPGVPLLFSQVILAWAIGLLFNFLIDRLFAPGQARIHAIVCIGIWALTCFLWWSQPARTSYNVLEPGPPNFQSYPFGDAILYDTAAHEFLTGTALPNDFWVKPLYSCFLAFLHILSGENYELLILFQIMILALIPVLVYLLVCMIGDRPAGVVASLLVILREKNSIALSNVIQVSHLKLLLSDVFSMGLVVFLLWIMFQWFEKPGERRNAPMIIGGVFGLLILTRGHPVLLLPVILIVIFLFQSMSLRERWQRVILFTAGVALVLIPWLWRIYETTGRFALQSPVSPYSANLAGLYSLTPSLANPEAFTTAVSSLTLEQSDLQSRQVIEFVIQHPDEVIRFISAHYFHNVVYSYIYLPQSFRIESLRAYVTTEPFWGAWQGGLSVQSWILLFLNIGLISLGIGTAWRKNGYLVFVPLLIGIGYNASVSVGRISGWRFIQPADWITLIYLSTGLIQFSYMIGFIVNRATQDLSTRDEMQADKISPVRRIGVVGSAVFFLLIGMTVTYGNNLFSRRYPEKPAQQLMHEYLVEAKSFARPFSENDLSEFLQNDRAKIVSGQAIYPYFLKANSGPINHYWPAYKPRPYNRVVFYLVGPESLNVVLPVSSSELIFPDGAEVIVLGCSDKNGNVDAFSVLILDDSPILHTRDPLPDLVCPLPEAN